MNNSSVSVALCSYNGERYLDEQLCSIATQSKMPAELVVCDDASTDSSVEVLKRFAKSAPFVVRLYQNKTRKGVVENYSRAISLCREEYVAICDQDDIWLPVKIALTLNKLLEAESKLGKDLPILIHTDLSLIDCSGKTLADSLIKLSKFQPFDEEPLKRLIAQNFVTGCTVLINRPLIKAALPIPETALFHDWWLALVAAAIGTRLYEPQPTVLYRQHDNNVLGAKFFLSKAHINSAGNIRILEKSIAGSIKQALALKERLQELPDPISIPYLDQYLDVALCNGIRTAFVAMCFGIRRMGLIRNVLFYLLLLRGNYLKYFAED